MTRACSNFSERILARAPISFALFVTMWSHSAEALTNIMSSVVSYQYVECFSSVMSPIVTYQYADLTNGGVMSPIASYQYFEWPGDSILNLQTSPDVSYFYPWGLGNLTILMQPMMQHATAGATVTFSVRADGQPPLSYQWLFNGTPLEGATDASLILANVQPANDGGYSVIVANNSASGVSAAASLAVLADGANGNTPGQPSPSQSSPSPISAVDGLVLVTHGFDWDGNLMDESWVTQMANAIQQRVQPNWTVVPYIWNGQAWGTPDLALANAMAQGWAYGHAVGASYRHVHLIGHSAGAAFVEATARAIKSVSPTTYIHSTFLDPYLSVLVTGLDVYGANADWADSYSAEDWVGGFTGGQLEYAYNADVSWLDPNSTPVFYPFSGQDVALSSHDWPHGFYMETVTNLDTQWCGAHYGFFLSEESTGWNDRTSHPIGNVPEVICSSSTGVQNPNRSVVAVEAVGYDVGSYALNEGATLISQAGFALNSVWSSLPLVRPEGDRRLGGHRPQGGGDPSGGTDTPAWLAVGLPITNAVNFVQFDAAFTDTNAAQGLLTVYWNTNQIGMLDERVALPGYQTYAFALPSTVTGGLYTLSFRLDSFGNSSSVGVTNVVMGFKGLPEPMTLAVSVTNGAPLLQLTAAPNFTYLIETTTNLLDWTPAIFLLNTNGTALFADPGANRPNRRFYRALLSF